MWYWKCKFFKLSHDFILVTWSKNHMALRMGTFHCKSAPCLVWSPWYFGMWRCNSFIFVKHFFSPLISAIQLYNQLHYKYLQNLQDIWNLLKLNTEYKARLNYRDRKLEEGLNHTNSRFLSMVKPFKFTFTGACPGNIFIVYKIMNKQKL